MSNQRNRTELRKKDFLVLRQTKNQDITKVITPQTFQIGLDDDEFYKGLIVKGHVQVGGHLLDNDGNFYIKGADGVVVTQDESGGITISAGSIGDGGNGGSGAHLSSNGSSGIQDFLYDGTIPQQISLKIFSQTGLEINGSMGLKINPTNAQELNATPANDDYLLIHDTSDTSNSRKVKKISVSNLMSAASTLTSLGHPIHFRDGLNNLSYSNTESVTVNLNVGSNGGLSIIGGNGSGGAVRVDPNNAAETSTIDKEKDYLLIHSDAASGVRKTLAKKIASLASDYSLSAGTGLVYTQGASYNGGTASQISIDTTVVPRLGSNNTFTGINTFSAPARFTSGLSGSLQQISPGVPYLVGAGNISVVTASSGQIIISTTLGENSDLTSGLGIKSFSFNGSSDASVEIDNSIVATLTGSQFTGGVGITGSLGVLGGITGYIQKLPDGSDYLRQGPNVIITKNSDGSMTISSALSGDGSSISAGELLAEYAVVALTGSLPNAKKIEAGLGVSISTSSNAITISADAASILGRERRVVVLDSTHPAQEEFVIETVDFSKVSYKQELIDIFLNGALIHSGSASQVVGREKDYTLASSNSLIFSFDLFKDDHIDVVLSKLSTATVGSDPDAQYLVLSATGSLSNERILNTSTGLLSIDNGPGNSFDISVDNSIVATLTGAVFTGPVEFQGSIIANGDVIGKFPVSRNKDSYYLSSDVSAGTNINLPFTDFSLANFENGRIDVFVNGILLHSGSFEQINSLERDYFIDGASTIKFSFEVKIDDVLDIIVYNSNG